SAVKSRGGSRRGAFGGARVELFGFHHIGEVDGAFAFDDIAVRVLLAFAHVFLDHVSAFNDNTLFFSNNADDAATLAFIGSSDDDDLVVFFDVKSAHGGKRE